MSRNELLKRWDRNFGEDEVKELLRNYREIASKSYIRINLSKITIVEVQKFLKQNRVKFDKTVFPNCLKVEKSFFNLSSSLYSLTGDIYLQDLASQIPVNCIDLKYLKGKKKIRVLDMAASPGSKTTQIADFFNVLGMDYEIVALEPEPKRLTKLVNNIQKQSFDRIKIVESRGEDFSDSKKFDLILLDAPCSGNLVGDFRWLDKREVNGILSMAELQKKLLLNASKLLKENGILIYSTCSMEFEENEANVEWILKNSSLKSYLPSLKFPFDVSPLKKGQKSMRFFPLKSQTQGFFVCCFK